MRLILLLAFIACTFVSGSDTDELHEDDLRQFDSDWRITKILFLGQHPDSWDMLKESAPDQAYRISRFWIRKSDMGTIEYQKMVLDRIAEDVKRSKPEEKEKLRVKYQGCIPEAVRCYYYDHAAEIDRMIEMSLAVVADGPKEETKTVKELEAAQPIFIKTPDEQEADVQRRLEELRKARDEYLKNNNEAEKD
jgi:hypothetical protein